MHWKRRFCTLHFHNENPIVSGPLRLRKGGDVDLFLRYSLTHSQVPSFIQEADTCRNLRMPYCLWGDKLADCRRLGSEASRENIFLTLLHCRLHKKNVILINDLTKVQRDCASIRLTPKWVRMDQSLSGIRSHQLVRHD
ncbi:hypothetical protein F2P81_020527 [Scophthalmus maximus]|uniref:Uncharacterized protein n=1 Tax=Scophthalmus maximus TaxID=52904 RepID=A0A6A4RY82_SCOMX|nr:hypothetical protein F2P81_020527 [Scophthalmus maximus]